jgi:hypothetical protein
MKEKCSRSEETEVPLAEPVQKDFKGGKTINRSSMSYIVYFIRVGTQGFMLAGRHSTTGATLPAPLMSYK